MPSAAKVQFVLRLLDDFEQFWMPVHAFDIGVDIQRPEPACETLLRVWRQVGLIPEEDDMMVEKSAVDLVKLRIGEIIAEIDAGNLGAERPSNWGNIERRSHGSILRSI